MRILILTEDTGGGHNACAKSIRDYFENEGKENVGIIASAVTFSSPQLAKAMSDVQIFAYRFAPEAMKLFFTLYEKKASKAFSEKSISYNIITAGSANLYHFIKNNNFDAVVCCHVLSAMMISKIKKTYSDFKPVTCFVATDCENDLTGSENNLDWYFIPDRTLSHLFTRMGIPQEKIIGSGIPVRAMFFDSVPKEEAKKRLGICPSHKHLLVMSGSMGAGAIEEVVLQLTGAMLPPDAEITVICGSNKTMYDRLSEICEDFSNFHILGFVSNISLYMDSADLYITKPGGLSTSEAAVKHLPMVLLDTVGGCETSNLYYYTKMGLAKSEKKPRLIAEFCAQLLGDGKSLKEMSESIKKSKDQLNSAKTIIDTLKTNQYHS